MSKYDPDLSLLFHALADPTRRSILTRLAESPARVTDLADPTGLRLPTVMRHLSVLQEAGLISTSRSEEHTSELQSLMRISYAVFCLKKKTERKQKNNRRINSNK